MKTSTHTAEAKAKMRAAWERRRAGFVPPMKGKQMSAESRAKMSAAALARPSNRTGKKHTAATRKKISIATRLNCLRGPQCHSYIDGKAVERTDSRLTREYKQWRYDVYCRDNFTCQLCGDDRGGNLNAHHIYSYAKHPDLRLCLDNGITICLRCHDELHYGKSVKRKKRRQAAQ